MTKIAPIFGPQNFFQDIYFYELLDIVTSYHPMQFKGKLMNQTWENDKKKLILGLILAQIWSPKIFFGF